MKYSKNDSLKYITKIGMVKYTNDLKKNKNTRC